MLSTSVHQYFTGQEKPPLFMQEGAVSGRGRHHQVFFSENIVVVHDKELSRSPSRTGAWKMK